MNQTTNADVEQWESKIKTHAMGGRMPATGSWTNKNKKFCKSIHVYKGVPSLMYTRVCKPDVYKGVPSLIDAPV